MQDSYTFWVGQL